MSPNKSIRKKIIQKVPRLSGFLSSLNRARWNRTYYDRRLTWLQRYLQRTDIDILCGLPAFVPASEGNCADLAKLTLQAADQTFPFLEHVIHSAGIASGAELLTAEEFCERTGARAEANIIGDQFATWGSDKSRGHNYHFVYGALLKDPSQVTCLLEIGLGTNQTDVVSTMGVQGKPGASLRAFRSYLPRAQIYGADVDRRILFQEERIQTFYVDQTDLASFEDLGKRLDNPLDLIIDDGLHSPNANLAVLSFGLPLIKPDGHVVIEDIAETALPIWRVVSVVLSPHYRCQIIKAQGGYMFVVGRAER